MSSVDSFRTELAAFLEPGAAGFDDLAAAGAALADEIVARGQSAIDGAALALDELVHDCAGDGGAEKANQCGDAEDQEKALDEASRSASDINNGGLAGQIACILAGNGLEDGERLIRAAAGLAAGGPRP
jgi:succinyl-CoA synthetase beta subunit